MNAVKRHLVIHSDILEPGCWNVRAQEVVVVDRGMKL
jgi:hypothetical protein